MKNSQGWDGKQRVDNPKAVLANPEVLEDAENNSDSDAPLPEEIEADEGMCCAALFRCRSFVRCPSEMCVVVCCVGMPV